ncbi:formimidoylglutamase [Maribacter cobaltidurans]|uniref:Formimidoylglutamase n=1 Tax=Maribacter cobaltidurans TaxID=1178778 RepID=A0A223V2Q2_9FLAO|nr:formimidoylglutamase [Maribacter cobaltidurans]ASV29661.1 formimidoylglutamase [Maribacter cobaltidurans]GGD66998.1 formimidoylglutamase [Maribacter cobaltidurans]
MKSYSETLSTIYFGRSSADRLYIHEKISCIPITKIETGNSKRAFSIIGYSCEEGVKRNQGRMGAVNGPDAIRKQLGKLPNHLLEDVAVYDVGTVHCMNGDMENSQKDLSELVSQTLNQNHFPIVLGGGHDVSYGTFNGLKEHLSNSGSIGIINFDAHFDLRNNQPEDLTIVNNSGTPFYQIAQDCKQNETPFKYLCLGIRKDANDRTLFETAKELDVKYIMRDTFRIQFHNEINAWINAFTGSVDHIYVTIDLDGFSSAYAPGVSAPSPMGFTPDVVLESLKTIMGSGKLRALDIAELNPDFDVDNQTAKLAASLVHYVIHDLP